MGYIETIPSDRLGNWVKVCWRLTCHGNGNVWIDRDATPDGCIELIWRSRGRSIWKTAQPDFFVGGLIERPAQLRMTDDAVFHAIRIWPWTWNALYTPAAHNFLDSWIADIPFATCDETLAAIDQQTQHLDLGLAPADIIVSTSMSDLALRTGKSSRWLQRWFEKYVGIPPRRYFRMLRFQKTLVNIQQDQDTLAGHAASAGYSDQPHMAREFRAMAGIPAQKARRLAVGPFLES